MSSSESTPPGDTRLPGFYRLTLSERREVIRVRWGLTDEDVATWQGGGLDAATADDVVENAVGIHALPLGVAVNFRVNGQDYLVPMAIEEPSVIAAASNAARLVREGGGFTADADPPVMTAQIEIVGVGDPEAARARIEAAGDELLGLAHAALPRLTARGGGAREVEVRALPERLVIHVHVDCRDAMGANMVNTVAEALAERVASLAGGIEGLCILTNLCDRRRVRVRARVPAAVLATPDTDGASVRDGIVAASRFAEHDPYRAATHNKGIMNGVDAVVVATGNDWRGVEAGAHAFAAASGRYRPLATWRRGDGLGGEGAEGEGDADLVGELEMPMAVGTVGGTLPAHAGARLAQRVLGVHSATTLAMIIGAAGLASNLAALRALATEGIQRGHMALHRRAASAAARADAVRGEPAPARGR